MTNSKALAAAGRWIMASPWFIARCPAGGTRDRDRVWAGRRAPGGGHWKTLAGSGTNVTLSAYTIDRQYVSRAIHSRISESTTT
jgi:hypothetical protein